MSRLLHATARPVVSSNSKVGAWRFVAKRTFKSEVDQRREGRGAPGLPLEEIWMLSFWFLSTGEDSVVMHLYKTCFFFLSLSAS